MSDLIKNFVSNNQYEVIRFFVTLVFGYIFIKIASKIMTKSVRKSHLDKTVTGFGLGLIRFVLFAAYIIVLLSILGVPMTTFVAMLSAVGLAIALALQGNLANFASALVILVFQPFKDGDFIETGEHMGTVKEIQLLFTHLLTPDNRRVIVPNSELVNSRVINYSSEDTRRVEFLFTASYDQETRYVLDTLNQVVKANPKIHAEPEAIIKLRNHGDSALEYDVFVWTDNENYWEVKYQMNEDVRNAFLDKGIDIPYPQRQVMLKK